MSFDFEYAVVGGGGMGSAAAYFLAREGKSVVLLERFENPHVNGASHGENRIIRYSYEWPDYVKLAKETYKLWHEIEQDSATDLLITTGGLDLGYPGNKDFDDCIESLRQEKVDHEILDRAEITKRFPQFHTEPTVRGLYQKDAGYLEPQKCIPVLNSLFEKHRGSLRFNSPVEDLKISNDSVEIRSGDRTYKAKKVILSLGPWASPLIAKFTGLEIPITVTLEQYAFFKPEHSEYFDEKKFPVFIVYVSPGELVNLYGFPNFRDVGVKVAEHRAGAVTTADTRTFELDQAKLKRLMGRAQNLFPDLTPEILKTGTCLYSNTPDHHFIMDKLPGYDNVIIGAGFSGHGFKFVPIVGKILRDLSVDGRTDQPIERFAIKRFASACAETKWKF